ncbi:MAG: hypothetical protein OSA88_11820 [Acidimicrobiales bacterium]|nr:hypothetical protein [Acidimicrobiales bacterium]
MNKFGFFDEQSDDESLVLLKQLQAEGPLHNEEQVLSYLAGGTQVMAIGGITTDLLSEDDDVIGSPHVFSDGTWCWTSDVVHYVETHHIALPLAFLTHMERNHWQCPAVSDPKAIVEQVWQA